MTQKFLVVAPSWLGDIVMSQSLMKMLRSMHPKAALDVYAPAYAVPVLRRMPEVSRVFVNPFAHGELALSRRLAEGRRLAAENYERAYVLPNSIKSALVPFFARIPLRIGFKGECRYGLLNRMRADEDRFELMVERYVALAFDEDGCACTRQLAAYEHPKLESQPVSVELAARLGIGFDRPVLVFGCGANWGLTKLWPEANYAEVASDWIVKGGSVFAVGTKADAAIGEGIGWRLPQALRPHYRNLCGLTALDEAIDVIAAARAAVCNDSGLLHVVAALGVPQVAVYGATSDRHTPPLTSRCVCMTSKRSCAPCFKKTCRFGTNACLTDTTPEVVASSLALLLK